MIQRIQSIFLFLSFLFNGIVFFTPLYSRAVEDPQQWIGIGFAIILTAGSLLPLGSIFLYKNRANQIRWVKIAMLLQVACLGSGISIFFSLGGIGLFLWDELIGIGLLLLAFVGQILALRNIRKDEELVRSMDRIR